VFPAGHDTKIFMNSTQPPSKRSRIERTVDRIIFFMFGLLFSMCLTGCIYFAWWTARYMPDHWYLGGDNFLPREYDGTKPGVVAVTNFITAFILYGEQLLHHQANCRQQHRSLFHVLVNPAVSCYIAYKVQLLQPVLAATCTVWSCTDLLRDCSAAHPLWLQAT
jgi:hypothetical protein